MLWWRGLQSQVALYAAAEDEGALLEYLGAARDPLGAPLYEPQFALRVARQGGHLKACVQLLCELNLYEARMCCDAAHKQRNLHTLAHMRLAHTQVL